MMNSGFDVVVSRQNKVIFVNENWVVKNVIEISIMRNLGVKVWEIREILVRVVENSSKVFLVSNSISVKKTENIFKENVLSK